MAGNWSSLPIDLLGAIAIKLESVEDFVYFLAVCRSWNNASSSIKHLWKGDTLPWLLLAENRKDNPDFIRNLFNPDNNRCYKLNLPDTFGARCWGSPYGWVAMVLRDLSVQLFNPLTNVKFHFPSCETLPHPPPYFDGIEGGEDFYQWVLRAFLKKLIVIKVSEGTHHDFIIAIIYDLANLAFARHGDQSWTSVLVREKMVWMVDLVIKDNCLFGLYNNGAMVYWKVKEFLGQELVKPKEFLPPKPEIFVQKGLETIFLIQSGSDFLMVIRCKREVLNSDGEDYDFDICYETKFFDVYKLNTKDKSWEETDDVGSVALFVGCNYSMSVCVTLAKCLQPNSIYFTDDEIDFWDMPIELGGHDMGLYDIKSGQISRFYEGDDIRSSFCPPTWFIPDCRK